MPICKYCGQETGGSPFCQNCGAKVEEQPIPQQPVFPEQPVQPSYQPEQPYTPQQSSYGVQPPYYTPGGAGGVIAGNIIAIVFGVVCCCCTNFISLISMILGIVGLVFASKIKSSANAQEEASNRSKARILMIIAFLVLVGGLVFTIIRTIINFNEVADGKSFSEYLESIYESVSESVEKMGSILIRR
ncbi:MAG: hypothetical protein J5752_04500 [Clostridiales bacterium]|nr:hypothetical protein [Clostridiales bacterium]